MKTTSLHQTYIVKTSDCGNWQAIASKDSQKGWTIRFSFDGESHHFGHRTGRSRPHAIAIAEDFIRKNSK